MVLQRASCASCQKITSQIEDDCLTGQFWPIRSRLGFRRKDRRSLSLVEVELPDGSTEFRHIKPSHAHVAIVMPWFDKAEILGQRSRPPESKAYFPNEFKASKEAMEGIAKMGIKVTDNRPRFAQMLAKIGLGVAVAYYGIDGFHPLVRDFIRFLPNDYLHWVGAYRGHEETPPAYLHSIWLHTTRTSNGAFIIASIRLFGSYGAPTNYVVVGKPLAPDILRRGSDNQAKSSPPHSKARAHTRSAQKTGRVKALPT
jgi:hypothetical protein